MVRADTIDGIDHILRISKNNELPFGGAQIIMFGDMYQLPPVVESAQLRKYFSDVYDGPYFFNAQVWRSANLQVHELQKVFRQSNKRFKALLDAIRKGSPSSEDFDILRERVVDAEHLPEGNYVTLTSSNAAAKKINDARLNALRTKTKVYYAKVVGTITANSFPTDSQLTLKVGSQVIFLKNDAANRWVNGSVGTVVSLSKESVHVKLGQRVHEVFPVTWEKSIYYYMEESQDLEQEVTSTFTQLPLKLAWAITIHKSQGCSYRRVAIDLRDGAFAHGQTYVALSRCRTLSGLYLLGEIKLKDIIVEPAITNFMRQSRNI